MIPNIFYIYNNKIGNKTVKILSKYEKRHLTIKVKY